jgi:hypothetical protein
MREESDPHKRMDDRLQRIKEAGKKLTGKKEEKVHPLPPELKDVIDAVEEILNSEEPLERIKEHLDNIICGEDANKQAIFLLLLSGLKWVPNDLKQILLLKGEPASGKTTLMRIADIFRTKTVGRFSKRALDYSDLENYEVLRLREIGGMDQEEQGVSTLKFLSADDMGYEVEISERTQEGWTTKQYRIPAMTVLTSTTRVEIDSQFERRAWIFNPDESEEQTKRIREWKAKQELEKIEIALGKRKQTSARRSLLVLQYLVRQLKPCVTVIPHINTLLRSLDTRQLRVRGDYDKILSALKLYGILLQRVTYTKELNGTLIVVPKPKHSIELLKILETPLRAMQSGLEVRTQKLIPYLQALEIEHTGDTITKHDRERLAGMMNLAEPTIREYIREWVNRGYMASDGKRPATYTLLISLDEILKKLQGFVGFENLQELEEEMTEETLKFVNRYCRTLVKSV